MNLDKSTASSNVKWSIGTVIFMGLLAVGWAWLTYVTGTAILELGLGAATTIFSDDMAHPWRAQFNTDLLLHMALVAAWIMFRTRSPILGVITALFAANGALFTFAYILVVTVLEKGDLRKVALGWRFADKS